MRKIALIVATTFVFGALAACSGSNDPATAKYWIKRLDDKKERLDALKELGKIGDKSAVPDVLAVFGEEGDWQPAAAQTLGQLGDSSVAPKLVAALDFQVGAGRDKVSIRKNRVNQAVARALAKLKAKEGVEPLVKLLETKDLSTKETVIRSLGELGDKRATDPLIKIASEETQPYIRKVAIESLGDLADPRSVPVLIKNLFVELPGTSFYFEARHSLLQVGPPTISKLIETLKRENKEAEGITTSTGEAIAEGAIEAKAAFVLGTLHAKEAEAPMLEALNKYYKIYEKTKNGELFAGTIGAVMELCYALGSLPSKKAIPVLEQIAMDTEPNIRVSATEALVIIGATEAVPTLMKAAVKGPVEARVHAFGALSRLAGADEVDAIQALGKGGDKEVDAEKMAKLVEASMPALTAAKDCKADIACWRKALTNPKVDVRERAAWELGWREAKPAVPDLLKALEDDEVVVRLATVWSLNRMAKDLDANQLQAVYDKWTEKIAYKDANANLKRLIVRIRHKA